MEKIKIEKGMFFWFFMFLVPIIAFFLSWLWPCAWVCISRNNSQINNDCLACVLFWGSIFMILLSSVVKKFTVYYKWGIYLPSVWILACLVIFVPIMIREAGSSDPHAGINSLIFWFLFIILVIMQVLFLDNVSSSNSSAITGHENKIQNGIKELSFTRKLSIAFWRWFLVIIIFVGAIILLKIVFSLF